MRRQLLSNYNYYMSKSGAYYARARNAKGESFTNLSKLGRYYFDAACDYREEYMLTTDNERFIM